MAKAFPDVMRERMEPLLDSYLTEFEFDMTHRSLDGGECATCHRTGGDDPMPNPAHRTAMDLYPRIMRAVGAGDELIAALLQRLRLPNEGELVAAASLYHAVQGQDVHEIVAECRKMVDWYETEVAPKASGEVMHHAGSTHGKTITNGDASA